MSMDFVAGIGEQVAQRFPFRRNASPECGNRHGLRSGPRGRVDLSADLPIPRYEERGSSTVTTQPRPKPSL